MKKNSGNNSLFPNCSNITIPIAVMPDPIVLATATVITEHPTTCNIPEVVECHKLEKGNGGEGCYVGAKNFFSKYSKK